MDGIAIIILNYVTWKETLKEVKLVKELLDNRSYKYEIVVVDNCSPNESYQQLSKHTDEFTLIASSNNGGYAAGNNIGLAYATQKGYKYSWVLNNDILFNDKDVLTKMLSTFDKADDIAVVSSDVLAPNGYLFNRDAVRPNLWDLTLGMLAYKKKGRASEEAKRGWLYVYRPQGCSMLIDNEKASQVDFMDEYTFLYCEEFIFSERLLRKGYRCACCSDTTVIHNHSYTVKRTLSKIKFIKTNLRSYSYYLKSYRSFNVVSRFFAELFYALKLLVL